VFRALAAEVKRKLLYLLARLRVNRNLAYLYSAIVAGVEASFDIFVVVIFGGWLRVGYARVLCGHEDTRLAELRFTL
jgi:hypothetical protein